MSSLPCLTLALLLAPCVSIRAQTPADSLRSLDSAWARSYATHDTTLALALLGDRLVMTSTDGQVKDKATELDDVRPTPGLRMQYFRTSRVFVEMYPEVGIVTGLAGWAFTYNAHETTVRRRYTAVYVRGGPLGWQLIALHMGQAPNPAPPG